MFHHMTQEEDVVERIYQMHFPPREMECQTSVSWISELVYLEERAKQIEEVFETNDDNEEDKVEEKSPENSSFSFGVIVNETDTNEPLYKKMKLKGPKSVRRQRGESFSSDEEEEE